MTEIRVVQPEEVEMAKARARRDFMAMLTARYPDSQSRVRRQVEVMADLWWGSEEPEGEEPKGWVGLRV